MKSSRYVLSMAAVGIVGVIGLATLGLDSAYGQPEGPPRDRMLKGDVVIMRCSAGSQDLAVTAYQGSPSTPAKRSASCAESISALTKDGFMIRDVGHYDDEKLGFVVYTLLR